MAHINNRGDRIERATRAAIGRNRKLGLERKSGQRGDKFVNFTCRWLAGKHQQLCDQVPVFGGETADVGVWPINPHRLHRDASATFDLYNIECDECILVALNDAGGFDAKAIDFRIEQASDLFRGRAEIDVGGYGGWFLTNKRFHL
jgi:hypothetical protein